LPEPLFPRLTIPDLYPLKDRMDHDLSIQLGKFPKQRRNPDSPLFIYIYILGG
jgi:hypothetical protein